MGFFLLNKNQARRGRLLGSIASGVFGRRKLNKLTLLGRLLVLHNSRAFTGAATSSVGIFTIAPIHP